ncbi:MAG: phage/plasmid primase, P4 family [Planctomycetales bacterium]|nr:phage/plasmid primase, P4 family [Planctomycetales bacterium]
MFNSISNSSGKRYEIADLKSAAAGRWVSILAAHGFDAATLDGRHHPCPACGGVDRFRAFNDVEQTGGCFCNQCFSSSNGDGIAAVRWLNSWTFPQTVSALGDYLNLSGSPTLYNVGTMLETPPPRKIICDVTTTTERIDLPYSTDGSTSKIVADVASAKQMPVASFIAFGATAALRNRYPVARTPMYDRHKEQCSYFDLGTGSAKLLKGLNAAKLPAGLFAAEWPAPGDTVHIVEGCKDASALHALGLLTIGLPCSAMAAKFAKVFERCHVVIVPDRDSAGEKGADLTAQRLVNWAASIRVAELPTEFRATSGDGIREILAMTDGETLLRQSLTDAKAWFPEEEDTTPPQEELPPWVDHETMDDTATNSDGHQWRDLYWPKGRTDRSNSRRLLHAYGKDLLFCFPWDKWLAWDSTRWQIDDGSSATRFALAVSDSVWAEAKVAGLSDDICKFAISSSNTGKVSAMLKLAAPDVAIPVDRLDANPWLLNVKNGTLDLRSGKLREHRREDSLTKLCPTEYDADAACPEWLRFLDSTFGGDTGLIAFLQRLSGYFLTGDVSEQILPIFYGSGSNGKSTLLNAIQAAMGEDYSSAAPPSLLMEKKSDSHPTELAGLFGKRLVVSQESTAGARLAEATVKSLTGGDKISARRMREDFWQFTPTHKLLLATNHKPRVKGTDHAIWRRLVLVPFEQRFWNPASGEDGPENLRQDKSLSTKLIAETSGILAWMVQGGLVWQRDGLGIPMSVRAATEDYRSESDTLGRFLSECCVEDPATRVKFSDMYSSLERWCNDGGDNLPSRQFTGAWLKGHGFHDKHSGTRWYCGLSMKAEEISSFETVFS